MYAFSSAGTEPVLRRAFRVVLLGVSSAGDDESCLAQVSSAGDESCLAQVTVGNADCG